MNKIWVVAKNEYSIAVTSKAFLVGLFMMPIFMGGAFVVQLLTRDQIDLTPRKLAIVDQTGRLYEKIAARAEARNESEIFEDVQGVRKQTQPQFIVEQYQPADDSKRADVELTKRVKSGELFAFAFIEPNVFDPNSRDAIRYHTQTPSFQRLPSWLEQVVNEQVKRARIEELQLSPESVAALTRQTPLRHFGLAEINERGEVKDAKEENRIATFAVPFVGLILMFMMVMSVTPTVLNNVLEEKMQKISEFLVSSVTPFQLMFGKMLGAVGVGLTLSAVYLGAASILLIYYDASRFVPVTLYLWFIFYLFIALIMYSSVFSAIGAACSEIRDAQSLMMPVMIMVIIPMMCLGPVLNAPSSVFSRMVSLFPPATPMLMFLRIAIPPGPAAWEIIAGTILTILFAIVCVWAAGKVFRVGILAQGQTPSLAKLASWILTK